MQMMSTMGRSSRTAAACLTAALLVSACSSSATTSSPGSAASPGSASSGPPLVIGASMSLSGDFAELAGPAKKGYELWAATVMPTDPSTRESSSMAITYST